jgi:hypothetical protein
MSALQQHIVVEMLPKIHEMVQDAAKRIKAQLARNRGGG